MKSSISTILLSLLLFLGTIGAKVIAQETKRLNSKIEKCKQDCPQNMSCFDGECFYVFTSQKRISASRDKKVKKFKILMSKSTEVEDPCEGVACSEGKICKLGECYDEESGEPAEVEDPCEGVVCSEGKICKLGECYDEESGEPAEVEDPCEGVVCSEGEICKFGECYDEESGEPAEVEDPCEGVVCSEGEICKLGECYDDPSESEATGDPCERVVCPDGYKCHLGSCYDLCLFKECSDSEICINGECIPRIREADNSNNRISLCELRNCSKFEICIAGKCFPRFSHKRVGCEDKECPEGYICYDGFCKPEILSEIFYSGKVLDENNKPIAGVEVNIDKSDRKPIITNDLGEYRIRVKPYEQVDFRKRGYELVSFVVHP